MKQALGKIIATVLSMVFMCAGTALGEVGECFITKSACIAVQQPYMMERVCTLAGVAVMDRANEQFKTILDPRMLDQLNDKERVAFEEWKREKKFITLQPDTLVFPCEEDLATVKYHPDKARLQGIRLPTFLVQGVEYQCIRVMPIGMSTCYWVALDNVDCR